MDLVACGNIIQILLSTSIIPISDRPNDYIYNIWDGWGKPTHDIWMVVVPSKARKKGRGEEGMSISQLETYGNDARRIWILPIDCAIGKALAFRPY